MEDGGKREWEDIVYSQRMSAQESSVGQARSLNDTRISGSGLRRLEYIDLDRYLSMTSGITYVKRFTSNHIASHRVASHWVEECEGRPTRAANYGADRTPLLPFSFPDLLSVRGAIDNSIGWGMAATGDFVARDDFHLLVRALLLRLWYDDAIRIWVVLQGRESEARSRIRRANFPPRFLRTPDRPPRPIGAVLVYVPRRSESRSESGLSYLFVLSHSGVPSIECDLDEATPSSPPVPYPLTIF